MKAIFFVLQFFIANAVYSQTSLYLNSVVAQYAMSDLKKFQDDTKKQFESAGIQAKNELSFPVSLQAELGVDKNMGKENILGGFINYAFTKGKVGYSDYSGETSATQNVSLYGLGIKGGLAMGKGFDVFIKASFNYSQLNLKYVTVITGGGRSETNEDFHSTGIILEPGVSWLYKIEKIFLRVQTGYAINIQGTTWYNKNSNEYLLNDSGSKMILDWSGLRMGLGIGYTF